MGKAHEEAALQEHLYIEGGCHCDDIEGYLHRLALLTGEGVGPGRFDPL